MREDLLHFIWKYKRLQLVNLATTRNEWVSIIDVGTHNRQSGPDFFNARLEINEQLWAGNVEIHLKSSDWYAHHHETDPSYESVILHVVWEHDCPVFRKNNSEIPTLELKKYISGDLINSYQNLLNNHGINFINCEKHIGEVDQFLFQNWLERMYFERLEKKADFISELLKNSKNDWEQVLFALLLKNFGLKINGASFFSLSEAMEFSIIRKLKHNIPQLESVFYGLSHLLEDDVYDEYHIRLSKEYKYLKHKFDLRSEGVQKPEFFKLRPSNFPTIRLSQLANLYGKESSLFNLIIEAKSLKDIYSIFDISASAYWDNHYTFGNESKNSQKKLTYKFIDLLVINTIVPLKFFHARYQGKNVDDGLIGLMSNIKKEDNGVLANFESKNVKMNNALESQALLHLYTTYCTQNKCLDCAVGNALLS